MEDGQGKESSITFELRTVGGNGARHAKKDPKKGKKWEVSKT